MTEALILPRVVPLLHRSAKAVRTTRASKRAHLARDGMASARAAGVPADVSRRSEEEEDNLAGTEQEEVIKTAQHGSGSVPANDSSANLPEGHNGSSGEQLNDVEDEISDHP